MVVPAPHILQPLCWFSWLWCSTLVLRSIPSIGYTPLTITIAPRKFPFKTSTIASITVVPPATNLPTTLSWTAPARLLMELLSQLWGCTVTLTAPFQPGSTYFRCPSVGTSPMFPLVACSSGIPMELPLALSNTTHLILFDLAPENYSVTRHF